MYFLAQVVRKLQLIIKFKISSLLNLMIVLSLFRARLKKLLEMSFWIICQVFNP